MCDTDICLGRSYVFFTWNSLPYWSTLMGVIQLKGLWSLVGLAQVTRPPWGW